MCCQPPSRSELGLQPRFPDFAVSKSNHFHVNRSSLRELAFVFTTGHLERGCNYSSKAMRRAFQNERKPSKQKVVTMPGLTIPEPGSSGGSLARPRKATQSQRLIFFTTVSTTLANRSHSNGWIRGHLLDLIETTCNPQEDPRLHVPQVFAAETLRRMEEAVGGVVSDLVFNLDEERDSEWQDCKIDGLSFQPQSMVRPLITESIGI
jgi:hypothetical protein